MLDFFILKNFELASEFLNRIFLETNSKKWKIFILFIPKSARTFHLRITIYTKHSVSLKYRGREKKFENFPKESTFHGINPRMEAGKSWRRVCAIYSLKIK